MKKYFISTVFLISTLSALSANAGRIGPYVRADVGVSMGNEENISFSQTNGTFISGSTDFDNKAFFSAGLGYQTSKKLRTDVTFSFRQFSYDTTGATTFGSQIDTYTVMANAYLDVASMLNQRFGRYQPYLQAGIGWSRSQYDDVFVSGATNASILGGTKDNFAWQLGGGLEYIVDKDWSLDFSYKYIDLGNAEPSINSTGDLGNNISSPPDVDLTAHEASIGAKFSF